MAGPTRPRMPSVGPRGRPSRRPPPPRRPPRRPASRSARRPHAPGRRHEQRPARSRRRARAVRARARSVTSASTPAPRRARPGHSRPAATPRPCIGGDDGIAPARRPARGQRAPVRRHGPGVVADVGGEVEAVVRRTGSTHRTPVRRPGCQPRRGPSRCRVPSGSGCSSAVLLQEVRESRSSSSRVVEDDPARLAPGLASADTGGRGAGWRDLPVAPRRRPRRAASADVARGDRPACRCAAAGGSPPSKPGGDDGDPHLVAEGVVDDGAEDDVGLGVGRLGDQAGGLVDLEQAEVGAAGDRQQDAVGAVDAWPRAAGWRWPSRRPRRRGPRRAPSRCP